MRGMTAGVIEGPHPTRIGRTCSLHEVQPGGSFECGNEEAVHDTGQTSDRRRATTSSTTHFLRAELGKRGAHLPARGRDGGFNRSHARHTSRLTSGSPLPARGPRPARGGHWRPSSFAHPSPGRRSGEARAAGDQPSRFTPSAENAGRQMAMYSASSLGVEYRTRSPRRVTTASPAATSTTPSSDSTRTTPRTDDCVLVECRRLRRLFPSGRSNHPRDADVLRA